MGKFCLSVEVGDFYERLNILFFSEPPGGLLRKILYAICCFIFFQENLKVLQHSKIVCEQIFWRSSP